MNYMTLLRYGSICIYFYAIVFDSQEKMFKTSVNARLHCLYRLLFIELERISAQTLYCQKLEFLSKICAAGIMCVSLLVFMQLFFESHTVGGSEPAKPARKHN